MRTESIGTGGRSEKIRTYNFKDARITDHRVGLSVHGLEGFLEGEPRFVDQIIDALLADDEEARAGASSE